jgi:hypothetical protein
LLDEYFSGVMDEVRIIGTALPIADIRTLMRAPVVPGTAMPVTSSTGLVAAYNFDSGTATDVTGLGHNGVISGAVPAAGIYGQALSFNGTSDLVTIADANDLDFTGELTLEAWVRPTVALSGWRSVILKESPGSLAYGMYASDSSNHAAGYVNIAGADRDTHIPDTLPAGVWSHVVVTYNKNMGKLRIYVDGLPRDERDITGNVTVSTSSLMLGGNTVWGEYFNGRIDNVRLYNRALNIIEVLANQTTPVN